MTYLQVFNTVQYFIDFVSTFGIHILYLFNIYISTSLNYIYTITSNIPLVGYQLLYININFNNNIRVNII